MEVVNEDLTLQANLGSELAGQLELIEGFDNDPIIDFKQLEDFINNEAALHHIPLTTDTVSLPNVCANGPTGMDGVKVMSQHPSQQQHPQHPSLHNNPSLQTPGYQQNPVGIGQLNPSKNPQFCHTQLPDSPPDSGSEPYSPADGGNQADKATYHVKASIVSNMAGLQHQQMPSAYMSQPQHQHHPHQTPHTPVSPSIVPQQMHAPAKAYNGYGGSEPPKLNHPPSATSSMAPVGIAQLSAQMLPAQVSGMDNLQHHPNKKRKYSESPNNTLTPALLNSMGVNMLSIKQEHPGMLPDCSDTDDVYGSGYDMVGGDSGSGMFLDGMYQMIKWQAYQPTAWAKLLDCNYKELPAQSYRVDADKGFNFSVSDDSFVCQKKNHFQVTVHVGVSGEPKYYKTPEGIIKPIDYVALHFYGVKMESQSQHIKVEQSQSDRSKRAFYPVRMELVADQVTKVTVGRLHFSETTTNNMRKKGKPNPDQRYFLLVVSLNAHSSDDNTVINAHASEKIIVRASNPGQFDNEIDNVWQKGHTSESVFHTGRVGINTDRPDEPLTVHGNIKLTGHIIQPSDARIKTDIHELDTTEQLRNITQLKVYKYSYDNDYAKFAGLEKIDVVDTGVIAQELSKVLPDAVRDTGDIVLPSGNQLENFQVVNRDRIYMENVGAVKELCKVTDKLENRINELETLNKKLTKVKRNSSMKSSCSSKSTSSSNVSMPSSAIVASGKKLHKSHHNHRGNYRASSSSQGSSTDPENTCSNRFIHVTIFVLVLVMLVCLVLITVLYILEKKEPNVHKHIFMYQTPRSSPGMLDGNGTYSTTTSPMGRPSDVTGPAGHHPESHHGTVPPLVPPTCLRITCMTSCCPDRPIDDQPHGSTPSKTPKKNRHHNAHKTPPGRTSPGQAPPGRTLPERTTPRRTAPVWVEVTVTTPIPSLPPAPSGQSESGDRDRDGGRGPDTPPDSQKKQTSPFYYHEMSIKGQQTTTEPSIENVIQNRHTTLSSKQTDKTYHIEEGGHSHKAPGDEGAEDDEGPMGNEGPKDGIGHRGGKGPKGGMDTNTVRQNERDNTQDTNGEEDKKRNMIPKYNPVENDLSKTKNKTPKIDYDNRVEVIYQDNGLRKKRSARPSLAMAVATIMLPQNYSHTLDPIYCTNDNCRSGSGGVYNYTVPFSRVFPTAPLTVEFLMTADFKLTHCNDRLELIDLCQEGQDNAPYSAAKQPQNKWDLPIGYYSNSSYQFRVTLNTQTGDVCNLPPTAAGVDYAEYNLKFYRVCDDVHG